MNVDNKARSAAALIGSELFYVRAVLSGDKWVVEACESVDIAADSNREGPFDIVDAKTLLAAIEDSVRWAGLSPKEADPLHLSIPDTSVKTAVLEFEELPEDDNEARSVVKWKAAKDFYINPEECSADFQILKGAQGGRLKALAVVTDAGLADGYEVSLSELGISVPHISTHTLNTLNLIAPALEAAENFAVILCAKGYFTVTLFNGGTMDFYRLKECEGADDMASDVGHTFTYYRGKEPEFELEKVFLVNGDEATAKTLAGSAGALVEPIDINRFIEKSEDKDIGLGVIAAVGALASFGL